MSCRKYCWCSVSLTFWSLLYIHWLFKPFSYVTRLQCSFGGHKYMEGIIDSGSAVQGAVLSANINVYGCKSLIHRESLSAVLLDRGLFSEPEQDVSSSISTEKLKRTGRVWCTKPGFWCVFMLRWVSVGFVQLAIGAGSFGFPLLYNFGAFWNSCTMQKELCAAWSISVDVFQCSQGAFRDLSERFYCMRVL